MIKLYGIPNCNKIRSTMTLLNRKHVKYEFVNVKNTPSRNQRQISHWL